MKVYSEIIKEREAKIKIKRKQMELLDAELYEEMQLLDYFKAKQNNGQRKIDEL